jgi:hypothetical protein
MAAQDTTVYVGDMLAYHKFAAIVEKAIISVLRQADNPAITFYGFTSFQG